MIFFENSKPPLPENDIPQIPNECLVGYGPEFVGSYIALQYAKYGWTQQISELLDSADISIYCMTHECKSLISQILKADDKESFMKCRHSKNASSYLATSDFIGKSIEKLSVDGWTDFNRTLMSHIPNIFTEHARSIPGTDRPQLAHQSPYLYAFLEWMANTFLDNPKNKPHVAASFEYVLTEYSLNSPLLAHGIPLALKNGFISKQLAETLFGKLRSEFSNDAIQAICEMYKEVCPESIQNKLIDVLFRNHFEKDQITLLFNYLSPSKDDYERIFEITMKRVVERISHSTSIADLKCGESKQTQSRTTLILNELFERSKSLGHAVFNEDKVFDLSFKNIQSIPFKKKRIKLPSLLALIGSYDLFHKVCLQHQRQGVSSASLKNDLKKIAQWDGVEQQMPELHALYETFVMQVDLPSDELPARSFNARRI